MKQTLRTEFLQKRKKLTLSEIQEKSNQIKNRLFSLDDFTTAKTVLFYVSYDNEVHTHNMIKESIVKGKQITVPCTDKTNKQLFLSELHDLKELMIGAYHILEPKMECRRFVALKDVDLIIVPGIVFDIHGQRIGHGMGYYDTLLQNATKQSKIGLAFELQLIDMIPAEEHDIKVDKIITEKRIITCTD